MVEVAGAMPIHAAPAARATKARRSVYSIKSWPCSSRTNLVRRVTLCFLLSVYLRRAIALLELFTPVQYAAARTWDLNPLQASEQSKILHARRPPNAATHRKYNTSRASDYGLP